MSVLITKTDGTQEEFDGMKLEWSLRRAGASTHTAERIRHTVESSLASGAQTSEIYKRSFQMLRHDARPAAARYSLRRALFEFGPSGHPFENYVAEMFKKEGWNVEYRRMIPGRCVSHEVDVYASREGEYLAAELKYHNDPGYKTDVKVALYVKARMDDIWNCEPNKKECPVDHGFLITNTKFTRDAIQYATCSGLNLLGWSYPLEGSLYDRIVATGLYPITALTTLRKSEKKLLIDQGLVTCEQATTNKDVLRAIGLSAERVGAVIAEANTLCNSY